MLIKQLTVGLLEENCYLVGCLETKQAVIIDPGESAHQILREVEKEDLTPTAIVNTHAHFDHVLAVNDIVEATGIPFYLHELELPTLEACPDHIASWLGIHMEPVRLPDYYLVAGQVLCFGTISLEVRFVPGHAPGHVVFVAHDQEIVFAGDTLFRQSIGRFDLPGADGALLVQSIRQELFSLGDEYAIYPGHGPETTIEFERIHNPYVGKNASFSF